MKVRRSSSGFVLVFSLVLALCAGVILAATLGYVSFAARQSAISAARSSCRLAAISAIEKVRNDVYLAFKRRNGDRSVLGIRVYDWFTAGWTASSLGAGGFRVDFNASVAPIRAQFPDLADLRVRLRSAPLNDGTRARDEQETGGDHHHVDIRKAL